ncbi:MAG: dihydropyrimidinase [Spirochaetota bacterium]
MDMLIRGGVCLYDGEALTADVLIQSGKISAVEKHIEPNSDMKVIEAEGLYVLPGIIDAHTHFHLVSRGTVTADSFVEGSRLAAFGGVTTVVDFADHLQDNSLIQSTRSRREAMENEMSIDFSLHQSVYRMHAAIPEELTKLKEAGVRAIKIFTTYKDVGYLIETDGLRELFSACRDRQMLVTVHAEDNEIIEQLQEERGNTPYTPSDHPRMRPGTAEAAAVRYVGELAGSLDMPVYIVHLSSAEGLDELRRLRARGVSIFAETTPHYLLLTSGLLNGEDGPLYVMTPPLRTAADNQALWQGVEEGVISLVATDHCAFTKEQKLASQDCRTIYPGIPGTEELLPLVHTFGVKEGRVSLEHLVQLLCENPAKMFGLYPQKGSLHPGTDADVVLFDPRVRWTITDSSQHTCAGYTPYDGTPVEGKVVMTVRRGDILVEGDSYTGTPGTGQFCLAHSPSPYR